MTEYKISNQELLSILETARLAPSLHNAQPWVVSADDKVIRVSVDRSHALNSGDPTGRQTTIGLGIFCEAIVLAAAAQNIQATPTLHGETVAIRLAPTTTTDSQDSRSIRLMHQRHSDRSIYRPTPVDTDQINVIEKSAPGIKANVRVVTDKRILKQTSHLIGKGMRVALSSPAFRRELSRYLVLPRSNKERGMSTKSMYINPMLATLQPLLLRLGAVPVRQVATDEERRWLSASAVVLVLADGDLSKYWFEAGRAYLRASLAIEGLGLSQATSAAIVEASNYHEDIEELLHTKQRILAVLRIGRGSGKRHYSPRVAAADLTTSRQPNA